MKKLLIALFSTFGVILLAGIYYFAIEPRLMYIKIKVLATGFSVREISKEPIMAGGKYFGEKYKVEFLDKNSKVLIPATEDNSMMVNIKNDLSFKNTSFFNYNDSFELSVYRCSLNPENCDNMSQDVTYGIDVTELEKDGQKYLCANTAMTKTALIKDLNEIRNEKVSAQFTMFIWIYNRIRGYPNNPEAKVGEIPGYEPAKIGSSNTIDFSFDKQRLLESLKSSSLYSCQTECVDSFCRTKKIVSTKKL